MVPAKDRAQAIPDDQARQMLSKRLQSISRRLRDIVWDPPPRRRVVYTCLFGYSEPFLDLQLDTDEQTDFVCVTDDLTLQSAFWTIVHAPPSLLDPPRRSKGFKHRPHLIFPQYKSSLYIDNTVMLLHPPNVFFSLLENCGSNMLLFKHPVRDCVYDEADAVKDAHYDDPVIIDKQMLYYRQLGYPPHNGLNATTVLLRNHNDPSLVAAMNDWHDQILRYSNRDQLSFNVIRHFHKLSATEFSGDLTHTELIKWPARPDSRRIPRDFDDYEYLYLHPDVAMANVNPRKHYLEHGIVEGRPYRRASFPHNSNPPVLLHVDETDRRGRELVKHGGHLNKTTFDIWSRLLQEQEWDYVIDVGANYGEMLLEAPLPRQAKILAFEPNMRIFPFLVKNIVNAKINCDCRMEAVSDKENYDLLEIDTTWSGLTRLKSIDSKSDNLQPIRTTTLSLILADAPDFRRILVKIDVEGDEIRVLKGLREQFHCQNFTALVEILHLNESDTIWLLEAFDVYILELSSSKLIKCDAVSWVDWKALLATNRYYANDVVIRGKQLFRQA